MPVCSPEQKTVLAGVRPVLKWVGGKRQILDELLSRLPESFDNYYEPFVGGGALFFHLPLKTAVLGDINSELINLYQVLQRDVEATITELKKHPYEQEHYYQIRALNTEQLTPVKRAARMIYLNKSCFNGLYRENSKGKFNVPFGRYKNPSICDPITLRNASKKLKKVKLYCAEYKLVVDRAQPGDLVYFDPPYEPLSRTSNFVNYNRNGFTSQNQIELAELFGELSRRGVNCMLSNSGAPLIRKLYADYRIHSIRALRQVNSVAAGRKKIEELIITNY